MWLPITPTTPMPFLDGVHLECASVPSFRRVKAPPPAALDLFVHTISARIARHLERRGLLVRDLSLGALCPQAHRRNG